MIVVVGQVGVGCMRNKMEEGIAKEATRSECQEDLVVGLVSDFAIIDILHSNMVCFLLYCFQLEH